MISLGAGVGRHDGPLDFYNPSYDLSNCGQQLIALAIARLQDGHRSPWWQQLLERYGIDDATLARTCEAFAKGITEALAYDSVQVVEDCLDRSGFLTSPDLAQLALAASIGHVCVGVMIDGVKTRTFLGTKALQETSMQKLVEKAEQMSRKVEGR